MTTAQVSSEIIGDMERLMRRRPGPVVVLIGGPPATGKTTLREAVREQAGIEVIGHHVNERLGYPPITVY